MDSEHTIPVSGQAADAFCPECGYNLRGIGSARCPECGTEVDREALARSEIPWDHRGRIGWWRGYWRTVWMVTRDPRRLGREATRGKGRSQEPEAMSQNPRGARSPREARDARRFRHVTVLVAFVPLAALAVWLHGWLDWEAHLSGIGRNMGSYMGVSPKVDLYLPLVVGASVTGVMPLALLLMLFGVTGALRLFVRAPGMPDERQERALALSDYTAAPLAWTPLILSLGGMAVWLYHARLAGWGDWFAMMGSLAVLAVAVLCFTWCHAAWRVVYGASGDRFRADIAATALPLVWLTIMCGALLVLPWTIGLFWLMVLSLR